MKSLITTVILLASVYIAQAQTTKVLYAYDGAGNRVSRTTINGIVKKDGPAVAGLETPAQNPATGAVLAPGQQETTGLRTRVAGLDVGLYPNPTRGVLSIVIEGFSGTTAAFVEVLDINGKQVYSGKIEDPNSQVDLVDQPAGTYLVNLTVDGKKGYYSVVKE
jgi:YD repeat-containing protein